MTNRVSEDPCMMNYLGLYVAIVWYRLIYPDEAIRIMEDKSRMKKMTRVITPELAAQIRKTGKRIKRVTLLSRKFGVSTYEIREIIGGGEHGGDHEGRQFTPGPDGDRSE